MEPRPPVSHSRGGRLSSCTPVACAPCEQAITLENIASSYCMADVVLRASLQDVIPQNSRAALHLTLSPRTKALKLVRKDGVVVTSTDYQQLRGRNRQKRMRYNYLKSRIYRHAGPEEDEEGLGQEILRTKRDMNWFLRYQQSILQQADNATMNHRRRRNNPEGGGGRKHTNRRRRARDSRLHDLDGITELVLGCSTCSSLIPAAGESRNSGLTVKKWLIMGRRIIDESSKKYSNQVQVTFLAIWDRNSLEFRRSLNAIRRQPVSYLCPKKPSVITDPLRIRGGSFNPSRNLKILRSAPSELSDAPVNANLWRNHRPAHSYGNQMHTEHRRPSSTTISPSNESAVAVSAFSIPKEQLDHNLTPDEMLPHRNDQNRYTQHVDSQRDAKQRSDSQSPRTYPPANELGQQELGREDYRQWRRERRKRQRGQKQRRKQIQTQQQPTQRRTTTLQPAHPINPYMNEQPDVYSRPYWLP
ncbi:unnamed protein product [Calicophoron daubneyi]|uniref:Uncharacterized protein n=1 Tax=Calicophoron daubneyi TaxID=300641 RepID=A0AAV2THQ6_CALDB